MDEGDGRNKALFSHRMALMKNNVPDIDKICSFINYNVFSTPLPPAEMEGIMRDVEPDEGENQQSAIATTIMEECLTTIYSGMTWWYRNGEYLADEGDQNLIRRVYAACEGEKTSFVDEVIKQIKYRSPMVPADTVFPIRFRNGILRKGEFIQIKDYRDFTPYFIDINYKPDAEPVPMVDEYINNLTNGDPTYKDLLMEVIGYVMITDPERIRSLGKFFMFRGDGANGKGTLLQIMKKIYNAKNCTNLSIKQLTDDRFKVTMIGKLANLGDDIEAEAIDNDQLKVLKNISTADTVATRHMYAESESTTFTIKLYFTTNSDISSFEKGYAYKRRIVWLPMFNKVEKPDPRFISKLTTNEALEYWIRLIVEGYKRLYHNMEWTECKAVEEYNSRYHENNNVCARFAKDIDPDSEIIGKTVGDMKEAFYQWDTEGNRFRSKLFKEAVWDLYKIGLGRSKVAGKTCRVFMRQDDTEQKLDH
jgi:putative DNA primase/helicase